MTAYYRRLSDMRPVDFAEEIVSLAEGFGWCARNSDGRRRTIERILYYLESCDAHGTNFDKFLGLTGCDLALELTDALASYARIAREDVYAEMYRLLVG